MNAVQYLFVNKGLRMSPGKMAAQAAHASVEAYTVSRADLIRHWREGGHYTKLVMEAESETHLLLIQRYIEDRWFKTKLIIDEGRTEVRPHSATALGVEIVDKDDPHAKATFESFRLYRDELYEPQLIVAPTKLSRKEAEELRKKWTAHYGDPRSWPLGSLKSFMDKLRGG